METQGRTEMAHGEEERAKEPLEEITEEQFLKELYMFMKKRDTPIERIPHLGFKQIDLFVMFKTVNDLGGYQQVTAQQLWKQVYNTLGGNPRSTSAATCTRRHYEKLLLPYECHVKGILISTLPPHQPKPFHYSSYSKDEDDGQRPAKRKLLSMPLHQGPHNLQSEPHGSLFASPLHFPHYYHPSHPVLPPYLPIPPSVLPPHSSLAPKLQFPFQPCELNSTDSVKEPLKRLRYLAEQYKTTSGLAEPLNLSVKASPRETNSNPVSSFAPPSSSKSPKFLNKPSTLYAHHPAEVTGGDGCEGQDGEPSEGVPCVSYPPTATEEDIVDLTEKDADHVAQKPCSPKTDFTIRPKEEREASPEVPPDVPREKDDNMVFEIPLSLFHKWLKLYGSSAMMHEAKEPPFTTQDEQSTRRIWPNADVLPTDLTFHMSPQHQGLAEDLRRNLPMPTASQLSAIQNGFSSYKPLPSGAILKNGASLDVRPFDQQDVNKSHISKSTLFWEAYDKETRDNQMKMDSGPVRGQPGKVHAEDLIQRGKQRSDMESSALLMLNSSSGSSPLFTTEEVMKLKRILSSSS